MRSGIEGADSATFFRQTARVHVCKTAPNLFRVRSGLACNITS